MSFLYQNSDGTSGGLLSCQGIFQPQSLSDEYRIFELDIGLGGKLETLSNWKERLDVMFAFPWRIFETTSKMFGQSVDIFFSISVMCS
ncbi:hypothetical protein CDAR_182841 [Caerostris darwini]|uniref:Uncharacterized protein n=1 Tax=Caerostris darwini TaxID=1538125 RepID=A0AAV4SPN2_9ARAC|nr:hypothetical protein CDAR_182841 [Caerostris darwini]